VLPQSWLALELPAADPAKELVKSLD